MDEEQAQLEQERAFYLAQARQNVERARRLLPRSEKASSGAKVSGVEGMLMVTFALIMDLLTLIPLVGIMFALIASGSIWFWTKTKSLGRPKNSLIMALPWIGGGIKSIPFLNFLPYYTANVSFTIATLGKTGERFGKLSSGAKI